MSLLPNSARGSDLGFLSVSVSNQIASSHDLSAGLPSGGTCVNASAMIASGNLESGIVPDASAVVRSESAADDDSTFGAAHSAHALTAKPVLNRIAEVRKSQGLSERTLAKRLNITTEQLQRLEDPCNDLSISQLVAVQVALEVPLVDLLEDTNSLSRPVQERAKLVKVMKTAAAIKECKLTSRAMRLAEMLREQLLDLMPELKEVSSWPQFGSRRGSGAVARILAQEVNTSQIRIND